MARHGGAEQRICPWVPGALGCLAPIDLALNRRQCPWVPGTYRPAPSTTPCQPHEPRQFVVPAQAGIQWSACDDWVPACAEKQKGDAAQFASMEFFHGPVIALNRRQQECFQRIDNNRGPLGATLGCDPWVPGTYRPKGSLGATLGCLAPIDPRGVWTVPLFITGNAFTNLGYNAIWRFLDD